MGHDDCKYIGADGGCDLYFHEPDERNRLCLICRDYEPKENTDRDNGIVHCRDCKHRSDKMYDYYGNPNDKVYVCQINDLAKKPDWFCADGERRTEDEQLD